MVEVTIDFLKIDVKPVLPNCVVCGDLLTDTNRSSVRNVCVDCLRGLEF